MVGIMKSLGRGVVTGLGLGAMSSPLLTLRRGSIRCWVAIGRAFKINEQDRNSYELARNSST